jgi:hypothetical protein
MLDLKEGINKRAGQYRILQILFFTTVISIVGYSTNAYYKPISRKRTLAAG